MEFEKVKEKDKGVRQQFVGSLYSPAFADDTYTASADDTTLLTSFTPPSHSYKLFFNTAQDTLCQLKRVLNADKTEFRLFTNSQTGQKKEKVI